jgi:hypothetical protein
MVVVEGEERSVFEVWYEHEHQTSRILGLDIKTCY